MFLIPFSHNMVNETLKAPYFRAFPAIIVDCNPPTAGLIGTHRPFRFRNCLHPGKPLANPGFSTVLSVPTRSIFTLH
jgi:hypothetical protein